MERANIFDQRNTCIRGECGTTVPTIGDEIKPEEVFGVDLLKKRVTGLKSSPVEEMENPNLIDQDFSAVGQARQIIENKLIEYWHELRGI